MTRQPHHTFFSSLLKDSCDLWEFFGSEESPIHIAEDLTDWIADIPDSDEPILAMFHISKIKNFGHLAKEWKTEFKAKTLVLLMSNGGINAHVLKNIDMPNESEFLSVATLNDEWEISLEKTEWSKFMNGIKGQSNRSDAKASFTKWIDALNSKPVEFSQTVPEEEKPDSTPKRSGFFVSPLQLMPARDIQ